MGLMQQTSMSGQADVYRRCLAHLVQVTSAAGATLYVEDAADPSLAPLLIHVGRAGKVPEFIDREHAAAAVSALQSPGAGAAAVRVFPSELRDGCLVRVAPYLASGQPVAATGGVERRSSLLAGKPRVSSPCVWIGFRFSDPEHADMLRGIGSADPLQPRDHPSWLARTIILVAGHLWDAFRVGRVLRDPTSQLPGRAQFQAHLQEVFELSAQAGESLGLLLINPDDFGAVNERLGRESGDRAVAEMAHILRSSLREDEQIFRYGGAVFGVLIPAADDASLEVVARKIRQSLTGAYLGGAMRLVFSVGAAVYRGRDEEDATLDDLGLLRRADHALIIAKRAGGGCSVLWSPEEGDVPDAGIDRLSGIFTANTEKDYRNMLLLWDTVALLSASTRKPEIVRAFVERLHVSLKPSRVALFEVDGSGELHELCAALRSDTSGAAQLKPGSAQRALLRRVHGAMTTESGEFEGSEPGQAEPAPFAYHAIPVIADGRCLCCLYLDGPTAGFRLDSSDLVFLSALAGQLGLALDRVALAERVQRDDETEKRRLRGEVQDLRQVLHSAKLVYSSSQMHSVLDTVRAVASTDVTILIDGESGTGKEMLARALHELSDRRDKPLIIVDCGAIAHNLIEAELFGHVKGAYTGAQGSSPGRIAQAEGGTLFLDEIGEVPLDVQAKLLRFVQEKEITPVGATRSRRVETRIVAATNRDLGSEAAAGRFREDLYYRLKVVTVTAPPLRDRPDDILPLAKHFLDKFALQYEKPVRRFEPEAEIYLQQHHWPGNVRELQNCVLRAVVLCTGYAIPRSALQSEAQGSAMPAELAPAALTPVPQPVETAVPEAPAGDPWSALQRALAEQVQQALANPSVAAVPLGRWLTEDLVHAADRRSNGNARRASAELGVAETTYRRNLEKVRRAESQGLLSRTSDWAQTADVLSYLVTSLSGESSGNVVERAKAILLAEVVGRVSARDSVGAALMGVTVPTYRRWLQDQPERDPAEPEKQQVNESHG